MASELYNIIEGVSREKGIDPRIVVSAVEDAIVVATRKYYKTQENLRAVLDKDSGKINAYAVKSIVEGPEQVEDPNLQVTVEQARKLDPSAEAGGELLIPKVTEGILGRIAAQLAKQVIFQKVREAERDTVYNEYIGHVGEIVNATVKRIEGPDVIVDLGKAEARMGRKEQSRLESFAVGERIVLCREGAVSELQGRHAARVDDALDAGAERLLHDKTRALDIAALDLFRVSRPETVIGSRVEKVADAF